MNSMIRFPINKTGAEPYNYCFDEVYITEDVYKKIQNSCLEMWTGEMMITSNNACYTYFEDLKLYNCNLWSQLYKVDNNLRSQLKYKGSKLIHEKYDDVTSEKTPVGIHAHMLQYYRITFKVANLNDVDKDLFVLLKPRTCGITENEEATTALVYNNPKPTEYQWNVIMYNSGKCAIKYSH